MARRILLVLAISALLVTSIASSSNAAPISPVDIARGATADVEHASFWGLPFPYGYRYRHGRGLRHVYVARRYGMRCQRVLVCR